MSTVRIYKKPDNNLILQHFNADYENLSTPEKEAFHLLSDFQNYPIFYKEMCNLSPSEHTGSCCDFPAVDHIDKWYIDNSNNVAADTAWDLKLMPLGEIIKRHQNRCLSKIDTEQNSQSPDQAVLFQNLFEFNTIKKYGKENPKKIYEYAKRNLLADNVNKPDIITLLDAKINSL